MEIRLLESIIMAVFGALITALIWFWRDSVQRSKVVAEETQKNSIEIIRLKENCPGYEECEKRITKNIIKKEDVQTVIQTTVQVTIAQCFAEFELKLINNGQITPRKKKSSE